MTDCSGYAPGATSARAPCARCGRSRAECEGTAATLPPDPPVCRGCGRSCRICGEHVARVALTALLCDGTREGEWALGVEYLRTLAPGGITETLIREELSRGGVPPDGPHARVALRTIARQVAPECCR